MLKSRLSKVLLSVTAAIVILTACLAVPMAAQAASAQDYRAAYQYAIGARNDYWGEWNYQAAKNDGIFYTNVRDAYWAYYDPYAYYWPAVYNYYLAAYDYYWPAYWYYGWYW